MDAPKPNPLAFLIMIALFPILCFGAEKGDIPIAPCTSIETYDFRNAAIEVNGRGVLKFEAGASSSYDGPDPAEAGRPDWQNAISLDRIIKPEARLTLRMIVISSGHVTGTGARESVLIFSCVDGRLLKTFDRQYLYGAKVTVLSPQVISITSGEWAKDDPLCCPSHEKIELFRWNTIRRTFYPLKTIRKKAKSDHAKAFSRPSLSIAANEN